MSPTQPQPQVQKPKPVSKDNDCCECYCDPDKFKNFWIGLTLSLHRAASSAVFALLMWFTLPYLIGTLNVSYWSACSAWIIYPISNFMFTFMCGITEGLAHCFCITFFLPVLLTGSIIVLGTLPELATVVPWLAVSETGDENLALEGVVLGLLGLAAFFCAGYQALSERTFYLNRDIYKEHFPELLRDVSLFLGRCIALVAFIFSYMIFHDQHRLIMFGIVGSWLVLASMTNLLFAFLFTKHLSQPRDRDACIPLRNLCVELPKFIRCPFVLVWIFFFFFVVAFYSFMPLATDWFALAKYTQNPIDSSYEEGVFLMALVCSCGIGVCFVLYYVNMNGCCRSNDTKGCDIGPNEPLLTWIFIACFTLALAGCSFMFLFDVDELWLMLGLATMVVSEVVVSSRYFRILLASAYRTSDDNEDLFSKSEGDYVRDSDTGNVKLIK